MHRWRDRNQDDFFTPIIKPKFKIKRDAKFFMLGSCFAREIERSLHNNGLKVLSIPRAIMRLDTNRYHLPAILQAIRGSVPNTKESFVEISHGRWGDPYQQTPRKALHSLEELMERRSTVDTLTARVHTADAVIITLGLTETWFDRELSNQEINLYAFRNFKKNKRFIFVNFDSAAADADIEAIIEDLGLKQIILTVSPIPLNATFSSMDVVTANAYSKAVLRAVAQEAANEHENVDYFPSYEMALYSKDPWRAEGERHINKKTIGHITQQFIKHYIEEEG